ncbi:sodium/glutamate symporter [Sporosarcina sp. P17b]|uniref:sodium/glutamate symporter n=1 Tax=Sporosarcina sp. P17b TaxID=2048260 RepID=UPI000C163DBD|nr:sodium/glutamate symporter [Sporosarcina sp. P17b]PIC72874.1 sodium:glutamate symporter [Sporosarcina sp. P17b]
MSSSRSENGMLILDVDMITFTAIGAVLLILGTWIVKRYEFLWKYSIPGPVIGGFGFSLLMWGAYELGLFEFQYDNTLYDLFMYVFFVTIGLSTGVSILKKGGKLLLIYMLVCWFLAILQNGISIGAAWLTGINPLSALMAGQASMQGGHGMAGSLAPLIESFGESNALTIGMAASTYGLIAGSLIGGPVGNWLISRKNLKIQTDSADLNALTTEIEEKKTAITWQNTLIEGSLIFVILAIGLPTAQWITNVTGFSIPGHIFSLFLGIIFRSINERTSWVPMTDTTMDMISNVSLNMFLVMAMMKLKLWELYDLALPLAVILVLQTLVTVAVAAFILYRLLGKNYDAAVMSAGFIGHGLGATPNGLVVMNAICTKYGVFSRKAFIIIPIAGTVLTDIVGVPMFVFLANLLGN